ncbi:MAG: S-methyl-5-thioribose-1-phosphate isomerase [Alphaproteobacteria bacterium]|jgi:methylthioribose-1-phosphate isomerase
MKVEDVHYRTIGVGKDGWSVEIIDQTLLPHAFEFIRLTSVSEVAHAISHMCVRGAPLIGATAAYGLYLGLREDASNDALKEAYDTLKATRPTAVNLVWALDAVCKVVRDLPESSRADAAFIKAASICDEDVAMCEAIGIFGLSLIKDAMDGKTLGPVNILTHCNAGWLATVDWGTALAPVYAAHNVGIPVHVWVDETRPRNQGASLTAWELGSHGVPYTVIADNAGGHLMSTGQVDLCITGTDRTTRNGDVCNKIGTYLKALAAQDNDIPFYVALPGPTIDWSLASGDDIPIEERDGTEVTHIRGVDGDGQVQSVRLTPENATAANPAFDVTPARLVTALITERGIAAPNEKALMSLYPEFR